MEKKKLANSSGLDSVFCKKLKFVNIPVIIQIFWSLLHHLSSFRCLVCSATVNPLTSAVVQLHYFHWLSLSLLYLTLGRYTEEFFNGGTIVFHNVLLKRLSATYNIEFIERFCLDFQVFFFILSCKCEEKIFDYVKCKKCFFYRATNGIRIA